MLDPHQVTRQVAQSLEGPLQRDERFTCSIHGPYGSGKSTALAEIVWLACDLGLPLNRIAVYAPQYPALRHLRDLIGYRWPELNPQHDLFMEMAGTPEMAYRHFSLEPSIGGYPPSYEKLAKEYLLVIARANNLTPTETNARWLVSLKPDVKAAIRADLNVRLRQETLPRNAYLHMVADHVAQYKKERLLPDLADMIYGEYRVAPWIKLLLLDEIGDHDRPLLARYFPNASVIITGRNPCPADITIDLPCSLRLPRREEYAAIDPLPSLVPPLDHFQSLFICTARWRIGQWIAWLKQYGFPPPDWPRWRTAVAAWKLDQGAAVPARQINPLLLAAGLRPEDDLFASQEINGWTNWRDMIDQFDPALREHSDAVIDRYDRLYPLPSVQIGVPERMRQCEAEVVIVDAVSERSRSLAESRATDRLIVLTTAAP